MPDYTLKIRRFDPESGEPAYWREYNVEQSPRSARCSEGILDARDAQDGSIGIRCSCQAAICGSCAVRINGKTALACNTAHRRGRAAGRHREPDRRRADEQHAGDQGPDRGHGRRPLEEGPARRAVAAARGRPPEREYIVPAESMIDITQSMACIQCGACVGACLSLEVDPDFVGPAALAKAYRFVGDPRDGQEEERLRDLAEDPHGMYDCTHCFACVEVCPKDVAPMNQIMRLRRRATNDFEIKDRNNGYGHEKAFVDILSRSAARCTRRSCCRARSATARWSRARPSPARQAADREPADRARGLAVRQGLAEEGALAPQAARPEAGQALSSR